MPGDDSKPGGEKPELIFAPHDGGGVMDAWFAPAKCGEHGGGVRLRGLGGKRPPLPGPLLLQRRRGRSQRETGGETDQKERCV
jgi:hypothetical protein